MIAIKENLSTARDILMKDSLTPNMIQDAVIQFLMGNNQAVIFGSQAVNIYVAERRATEDIDIASTSGKDLAEDIKTYLNERFNIAARVRTIRDGIGFRVYQVRKEGNRHLVDIRPVDQLPPAQQVEGVLVAEPAEIIANKIMALIARHSSAKAGTDYRDLYHLLLTFPNLKREFGAVYERLTANNANKQALELWGQWVDKKLEFEDSDLDSEFDW